MPRQAYAKPKGYNPGCIETVQADAAVQAITGQVSLMLHMAAQATRKASLAQLGAELRSQSMSLQKLCIAAPLQELENLSRYYRRLTSASSGASTMTVHQALLCKKIFPGYSTASCCNAYHQADSSATGMCYWLWNDCLAGRLQPCQSTLP